MFTQLASWRTTACGVLVAVGAWISVAVALLDGLPSTQPDYGLAVSLTIAAIGLVSARDSNK